MSGMTAQAALFEMPAGDFPAAGILYLMTDGYLLKFGWSGRSTPKPRSGELRATVIGFQSGDRADERKYLAVVEKWSVGGEWFRVPDDSAVLHWLWLVAQGMGQWKGRRATEVLADVIANNLRRAA